MADNLKGEVHFDAVGQKWTLVYSIDSIIALEEQLDLSVTEIAVALGSKPRLRFLRSVFWAGLLERHPDVTEAEVGKLFIDLGLAAVGDLMGEAFHAAFTPATEAAKGDSPPPKRRAKAGTGQSSTLSGVN